MTDNELKRDLITKVVWTPSDQKRSCSRSDQSDSDKLKGGKYKDQLFALTKIEISIFFRTIIFYSTAPATSKLNPRRTLSPSKHQPKMHIPTPILLLAALSTTISAWTLDLRASDGRSSRSSGRLDSGCKDLSWVPALNVNGANFNPVTNDWPDPGTFELYVNKGCSGLSYRNGPGNWVLTPARTIRSYKVY